MEHEETLNLTAIEEAVEKARREWEAEAAERERIASLSAEERLMEREAELERREQALKAKEVRAAAVAALTERGLPIALAAALPCTDEAACMEALEALEQVFRAAVQQAVDERLKGETPKTGTARAADTMTDAEYYSAQYER